jgi:hypothetical protein
MVCRCNFEEIKEMANQKRENFVQETATESVERSRRQFKRTVLLTGGVTMEGAWQCGVCKRTFPCDPTKSPKDVVPAWARIKWNNEEHKIPICKECLQKILWGR